MQEKFIQSKEYKEALDTKKRFGARVSVLACMSEEGGEEESLLLALEWNSV